MTEHHSTDNADSEFIPAPAGFPVVWENPGDERLFWTSDRMHFPEPMTPMAAFFCEAFNDGFRNASEAADVPITIRYGRFNNYLYNAVVPWVSPEEMDALSQSGAVKLEANISRLWEWWTDELLPEVKDHLAYWESIDPGTLSMRQLLDHLDETLQRLTRLWDIHFQIAFPFLVAPSMFEELYAELFGGGGLDSYRLTQGFGNKTVEGGHALWRLSRRAIESEQVRSALQDSTGSDLFDKLATSSEGKAFSAEFRAFLDEWGQRSDVFAELGNPNWIEDPTTPIKNLKDFITEPDRDLASELSDLAAERERLIGRAREQLNDHPQEARDRFEGLLKAAQAGTVLQEDHNHWIDQRGTYKVRQVILEFGNRFVDAGVIAEPNDVFYLTPDELRAVAENIVGDDRRQIVAARKSDIEASRNMATPEAFGTRPSGPPPDDPLGRAIGKFWGAPPEASDSPGVLRGNACSRGKARGPARIVLSLSQAGKLEPGDVLVAPGTMPAWTPLFASISAVVTDAGGVLSHAAVVAREYGIPAVLGTGNATKVIQDGQIIEVDGEAGIVSIVESA